MANDLDLPSIADGQADGQWQSSNDADAAIANAVADIYSVDFSSGSVTLTATQYRSALIFKPSAALAAARTLTLPAVKKPIWFRNGDDTYTVTLKSTDGGSPEDATTIDVGPGEIFFGYTNGSSPGLFGSVLAESSGGGSEISPTQTEFLSGIIASPSNKDYRVALNLPYALTVTKITTRSASGTCTLTGKINTTALGGTANSVSSTEQSQSHASSNAASAGDDIVLTVSSNSSCADLSFLIEFTRTLD